MKRTVFTAMLYLSLSAGSSFAAPDFRIQYPNGIPRVEIVGDYRHSRYTVWRAGSPDGAFTLVTDGDMLCVGPCYESEEHTSELQSRLHLVCRRLLEKK